MTKVKYNQNNLENIIKPTIQETKDIFQESYQILEATYCPSDFTYRTKYQEITNRLRALLEDLSRYENWIEKTKNAMEQVSANNLEEIKKLEESEIKKRVPFYM